MFYDNVESTEKLSRPEKLVLSEKEIISRLEAKVRLSKIQFKRIRNLIKPPTKNVKGEYKELVLKAKAKSSINP